MQNEDIDDWLATHEILFDDVMSSVARFASKNDGFSRRSYVRTVFAAIEGSLFGLKRVVLHIHNIHVLDLKSDDLGKLMEGTIDGSGTMKKRFLPFADSVRFAFKTFAKVHQVPCLADFNSKGWNALLKAADVRNRLMHPKSSRDLDVSDDDLASVETGVRWYFDTRNLLVGASITAMKEWSSSKS